MPLPLPSCVLQFLKYEQTVGVLAIVLGEMKADVGYFFVILMVLTVGFGVAFATLLRASQVLLPPLSPPPPSPHHPPLHTAPGAFSRRFLQALMPLPPPSLRASQVEPWYVGCVQSGRLGGATAGPHARAPQPASEGLGLPSALGRRGEAQQVRSHREAVAFQTEAAQAA